MAYFFHTLVVFWISYIPRPLALSASNLYRICHRKILCSREHPTCNTNATLLASRVTRCFFFSFNLFTSILRRSPGSFPSLQWCYLLMSLSTAGVPLSVMYLSYPFLVSLYTVLFFGMLYIVLVCRQFPGIRLGQAGWVPSGSNCLTTRNTLTLPPPDESKHGGNQARRQDE